MQASFGSQDQMEVDIFITFCSLLLQITEETLRDILDLPGWILHKRWLNSLFVHSLSPLRIIKVSLFPFNTCVGAGTMFVEVPGSQCQLRTVLVLDYCETY